MGGVEVILRVTEWVLDWPDLQCETLPKNKQTRKMLRCNPTAGKTEVGGFLELAASQSSKFQVQGETLPQQISWRMIRKTPYIELWPPHGHTHTHTHKCTTHPLMHSNAHACMHTHTHMHAQYESHTRCPGTSHTHTHTHAQYGDKWASTT